MQDAVYMTEFTQFADQMPSEVTCDRVLHKNKKLWSVLQLETAFAALGTQIGSKIIVTRKQITVHRSLEAYWLLGSCHCPLQPRQLWWKNCPLGTMRNMRHCEDKGSI